MAPLASVAVAYFLAAAAVLIVFGESTPIWYSNAFVIVALLHQPLRTWPVYIAAGWLADAAAVMLFGHPQAVVVSLADVLEILVVAGVIRLSGGIREPLFEGGQIARVLLACLAGPAVSAALGGALLARWSGADFQQAWRTWYSASALGLLIVAPLLLSWLDPTLRRKSLGRLQSRDGAGLAAGAAAVMLLMGAGEEPFWLFFSFPLVLALAWAYGLVGATVGVLALGGAAVATSFASQGPFVHLESSAASLAPSAATLERIETLQAYLAAILLATLPLTLLQAQQRHLAAGLRRAGEARAEFLAVMSHEIRTPLTAVLGMADLLASEELTRTQRGYVEAMRSSGRHLLSIINDILDFSRIESGKLELDEIDFTLADVVEPLRSLAHPMAVERGLALLFEQEPGGPGVLRGDPLRLRQVLLNLVGNAIKFTRHGNVTVRMSHRPREDHAGVWLRVCVQDSGIGIEPAHLAGLFAPFTQADRSVSRRYGGTGLGLAISKRLVDAMGGTIRASSVPGEGSRFEVEVPLGRGKATAASAAAARRAAPLRPLRILIAEDVEVNRQLLAAALGRQGHDLSFAEEGTRAVALAQQESFDLVLMDVQMPGMDGVEATRRIRRLPPPRGNVPIVGLTANVMARERESYLAAGMDDCLPKPIEWERLHSVMAGLAGDEEPSASTASAGAATTPPSQAGTLSRRRAAAAAALLDEAALDSMRALAGDELPALMQVGFAGYEAALARMCAPGASSAVLQHEAHKIKGSAGTLGLAAVGELAGRIEHGAGAGAGEPPQAMVAQLRDVVTATRAELERRGLLSSSEG